MGWKAFNLFATNAKPDYLTTFPSRDPAKAREYLRRLGGTYESHGDATLGVRVTRTVTISSAPSATTGASGVFTSSPPSQSRLSCTGTGGKRSGMLALASTMSTVIAG